MFRETEIEGDFAALLESLGIELDTSNMTEAQYMFGPAAKITRIPAIDLRKATTSSYAFHSCSKLVTIDKLIVSESTPFSNSFNYCSSLVDLTIEGTIGKNGLDLKSSTKLSKISIESVINALSTTTSGLSIILSRTAVISAFGDTNSDEWVTLIATKPNWTITLS